jgi:predicted dehydrogenase
MLRIGLIGAGRTVQIAHAPALSALTDRYVVAAIADRDPTALEHIGTQLGVPPEHRYAEYREMLLREPLDLVDIALPHAFHHEAALQALLNGLHIITERPLALSLRDAQELLQIAETRGRLIAVLHFYLFYPPFREAIRLVRAGAIGDPFFIRCEGVTGGFGLGSDAYHPEWHGNPEIAGGGVWIDSGYHSVYLCGALMGSPITSVAAAMGTFATKMPVEDTAAVLLTHENGGITNIQAAWSVPSGGRRVFDIYGTQGTIALDHDGYPLGVFSHTTQAWQHPEITVGHAESFIGFFTALAECLRFGAPPPVSHRDALYSLEAVLAAYRAGEQGTVESVGGAI